jgi:hypothetical protein
MSTEAILGVGRQWRNEFEIHVGSACPSVWHIQQAKD